MNKYAQGWRQANHQPFIGNAKVAFCNDCHQIVATKHECTNDSVKKILDEAAKAYFEYCFNVGIKP